MTNDQEGGKDLAPLNNEDQPRMNRGVELMMRNKNRRREEYLEPKPKWFQFRLGQSDYSLSSKNFTLDSKSIWTQTR